VISAKVTIDAVSQHNVTRRILSRVDRKRFAAFKKVTTHRRSPDRPLAWSMIWSQKA
jgi:hypothetical protein